MDKYVILDLETTRNEETKSECIIEVFAIKIDNDFNKLSEFYQSVNPGIPLTYITKKVTGLTDSQLRNAPNITQVIPKLYDFLENYPVIAHNASFEFKVLKEHFENHNLKLKNKFIDSLKMSKELTEFKKNSLSYLKEQFNIVFEAHRAKDDVLSLLEILKKLDELHQNKKGCSLLENIAYYNITPVKQTVLNFE